MEDSLELEASDFQNIDIPILTDVQKENSGRPLSTDELFAALKILKNNKTPGSDGLPAEFYKKFWPQIKDVLLASYNFAFTHGALSIGQRLGVIVLIPKKDRDRKKFKNWC